MKTIEEFDQWLELLVAETTTYSRAAQSIVTWRNQPVPTNPWNKNDKNSN